MPRGGATTPSDASCAGRKSRPRSSGTTSKTPSCPLRRATCSSMRRSSTRTTAARLSRPAAHGAAPPSASSRASGSSPVSTSTRSSTASGSYRIYAPETDGKTKLDEMLLHPVEDKQRAFETVLMDVGLDAAVEAHRGKTYALSRPSVCSVSVQLMAPSALPG